MCCCIIMCTGLAHWLAVPAHILPVYRIADLVALVTVYDAIFATAGVLAVDGSLPDISSFTSKSQFFTVVAITSLLAVLARLLYQRALSIAPLSLTVPYLAFTPAFVVMVSPFFLVGEVPSPLGMLGVFVVSTSGYMLGLVTAPGKIEQPSSPSKAKLPLTAPLMRKSLSASSLQQEQQQELQRQQQQQQPYDQQQHHQQQQRYQEELRDHNHRRIGDSQHGKRGSSKSSQLSVWAMAYYKGKAAGSAVITADHTAAGVDAPGPQQWLTSSKLGSADSSSAYRPVANGSSNGADADSTNWDDSQAKLSKDTRADGKSAAALAASRAARLIGQASGRAWGKQWLAACVAAASGTNAAPAMVLSVAFLYSLTASLDKLGIAAANHSLAAYFLGQRLLIGLCGAVYLLCFARAALRHIASDMVLLCSISLVEQFAVVFYLIAINNILVSYVVAIKRINVLLSTLIGCVLFKERVGKRIPYIIVMLCGMLMIVLQPGHEDLHHSHHTRHHKHHLFMLL